MDSTLYPILVYKMVTRMCPSSARGCEFCKISSENYKQIAPISPCSVVHNFGKVLLMTKVMLHDTR